MRFDVPYLVFGMLACISLHVQAAPFNGVADDGLGLVVRDSLTNPKTHLRVRASSSEQSKSGSGNYVSLSGYGDYWNVVMGSGQKNVILVRFDGLHGTALTRQGNLFAHLDPTFEPIEDRVHKAIKHLDPLNSRQVVFTNQYKFHGAWRSLNPKKIVSDITGAGIQYLEHGGRISIDQEGVPTITVKIQADGKVVPRNIRVMDGKVLNAW
ncbi:uncharacterized protein C8R40DRAFT_1166523 [Lentinula edodes]|uniref:uncharacterized protein n=1 Tax=Lentinula edodes TaxID=5353 RepID=UPI001E8DDE49|nr:uncharacterized protein C8R40DRAFT_1166523 [Lentinula edodes]KAH7879282.1 hypothetical protein C8R40DRAFT_1166523 [Lentinula edodes]